MKQDVDRWQSVEEQISKFSLKVERVPAFESRDVLSNELEFVTSGVHAVWKSHMKCMQLLLQSSSTHALILEDDFKILKPKQLFSSLLRSEVRAYDVIQLGWIVPGIDNRIDLVFKQLEHFIFRSTFRLLKTLKVGPKQVSRLRPRAHGNAPKGFIPDNFQPGGHCYMVSRKFASSILKMNDPQFLAVDDLYIALAKMRTLKFIRSKRNLASQRPFQKWQGQRFKIQ